MPGRCRRRRKHASLTLRQRVRTHVQQSLSACAFWPLNARPLCAHARSQSLHAGDLVLWDKNGNGYYVMPKNRWYVESGRYDEKGAGGGLGQWDRDHHYDVWGKVCARGCVLRFNMQLAISC